MESAHALAALERLTFKPDDVVVVNLSGRGDKDMVQLCFFVIKLQTYILQIHSDLVANTQTIG